MEVAEKLLTAYSQILWWEVAMSILFDALLPPSFLLQRQEDSCHFLSTLYLYQLLKVITYCFELI